MQVFAGYKKTMDAGAGFRSFADFIFSDKLQSTTQVQQAESLELQMERSQHPAHERLKVDKRDLKDIVIEVCDYVGRLEGKVLKEMWEPLRCATLEKLLLE